MDYGDVERFHLLGIIPKKKRYGTPKDVERCRNSILKNQEFIQFALKEERTECLEEILPELVEWVIVCNAAYYWNMERTHNGGKQS
ncbi:hypothetical protein D3Z47_02230 [Lachnospiraceae bacterium]|nr:hypothetical protein [Lachnospiraceae bacterium]